MSTLQDGFIARDIITFTETGFISSKLTVERNGEKLQLTGDCCEMTIPISFDKAKFRLAVNAMILTQNSKIHAYLRDDLSGEAKMVFEILNL